MKKIIITSLIITTVIVAWLLLPPHQKDKFNALIMPNTPERQCYELYKNDLKDPYTAYLESSYIWTKELEMKSSMKPDKKFDKYDEFIVVKVRAKNGFGAYGVVRFECPLVQGSFRYSDAMAFKMNINL